MAWRNFDGALFDGVSCPANDLLLRACRLKKKIAQVGCCKLHFWSWLMFSPNRTFQFTSIYLQSDPKAPFLDGSSSSVLQLSNNKNPIFKVLERIVVKEDNVRHGSSPNKSVKDLQSYHQRKTIHLIPTLNCWDDRHQIKQIQKYRYTIQTMPPT